MVARAVPSYREFSRFPARDPRLRTELLPEAVPAADVLADIDALRRSESPCWPP